VSDRDGEAAVRVAGEICDSSLVAHPVVGDVGSAEGAAAAVAATLEHFGGLDVVFNNAGISGEPVPVAELSTAEWDEVIRVNLRGVFLVLREAARSMIERRVAGTIVNMASSMSAWDVLEGGAAYAASKAGILGLTRVAALELARYGIRVNAVCPGVIETSLGVPGLDEGSAASPALQRFESRIPLRRIGQPDDVASVVCFLASGDSAHVTGAGWLIDGGQTLQSWSNAPNSDRYPLRGEQRGDGS
jgi:NAD(P)-dependent dehydrogenase (short-subunit alcohol dehydrogenase family)